MLLGRSLRDVVILLFHAALLVALSVPFGLSIDPAGVAVAFALLALVGLMVAPVSYAMALAVKSEDALAPMTNGITLPLLLLSGMMLPMYLAPDWLRTLADVNPCTTRSRPSARRSMRASAIPRSRSAPR